MGNRKDNQIVTTRLHKSFFENIFEPERKRIQLKLGLTNFTQPQFTEFLAKSKIKMQYPKTTNTFAPRRIRGFRFTL